MQNKIVLTVLLLFFCFEADSFEITYTEPAPLNGIQVFVFDEAYKNNVDTFFAEIKAKGVDTVLVRVFHNKNDRAHFNTEHGCAEGGIYFNSAGVCTVSNILPELISTAHKHNIKLYAWMATRSLSAIYSDETASLAFTEKGAEPTKYVSIFHSDVQKKMTNIFKSLALTGVDGILIQDDFIMKYNEGADKSACELLEKETEIKCNAQSFFDTSKKTFHKNLKDDHAVWSEWKSKKLADFFLKLRKETRTINPDIKWMVNVYYETPVYPDKGLEWYAQDIEKIWLSNADYIAVMLYAEQIKKELQYNESEMQDFAAEVAVKALLSSTNPDRVVMKLQVKPMFGGKVSHAEYIALRKYLVKFGAKSFIQLPIYSPADVVP